VLNYKTLKMIPANYLLKVIYLAFLFQFTFNNVYGQIEGDAFIDRTVLPHGLKISVDSVKDPFLFSDRNVIGFLTFSSMNKSVTYNIFNYTPSDSVEFSRIKMERLSMENCSWKGNKNPNKNFRLSFIKGNYYYLLEFCPCGANSKGRCGNLALKINKWLRNK
jgi:hypothetical protein